MNQISELHLDDRPREKLARMGASQLSTAELIAIILGSGNKTLPVMKISSNLVGLISDNVSCLQAMSIEAIAKVKGIGRIKAATLLAALELGRRSLQQTAPLLLKEDCAVEMLIATYLTHEPKPQYHLVLLNARSELLATSELYTEKRSLPDLNAIIDLVLDAGAAELILCRNEIKLPVAYGNREKAFIIQLDAAASMLKLRFRGLLLIKV